MPTQEGDKHRACRFLRQVFCKTSILGLPQEANYCTVLEINAILGDASDGGVKMAVKKHQPSGKQDQHIAMFYCACIKKVNIHKSLCNMTKKPFWLVKYWHDNS